MTMRTPLLAAVLALIAASTLAAQRPVREPTPRPPGPATVTATISGPSEITVTWDAVPGADRYQLGFHSPPDGWRSVREFAGTATTFVHADRDLTRTHQYQVVAVIGDMASLPRRSNVTAAQAAPADTTPTVTTPVETAPAATTPGDTITPGIRVLAPASCYSAYVDTERMICQSEQRVFDSRYVGSVVAVARCPDFYRVVSGGHGTFIQRGAELRASAPDRNSVGWRVWVVAYDDPQRSPASSVTATVLCERRPPR